MLILKKIAVTGSLSSGKSSVCHFIKEYQAYVISADAIVHRLLTPETLLGQQVIDLLGLGVIQGNSINRKAVAELVFHDDLLLKKLEQYIHPVVRDEIKKKYQDVKHSNFFSFFVVEIPLLFESGMDKDFDDCIVIASNFSNCKKRFIKKTGYPVSEFDQRIQRQMPISEKIKKASFIIYNDGSFQDLKSRVKEVMNRIQK